MIKFRRQYEKCLIIEHIDGGFYITQANVNNKDKKIHFKRNWIEDDLSKIKRPLLVSVDKLVLALDSSQATTIESVINLKRSRPEETINDGELEHLIFRALWEFLNRYRVWTAKKMGVKDLDLVLASIDIRDVRLSNHRIFNPLGFRGSEFSLRLRGTFIPRSVIVHLHRFKPWTRFLTVIESLTILLNAIPKPDRFLVQSTHNQTTVFSFDDEEQIYHKKITWGGEHLVKSVAKMLLVEEDVAHLILERYINNQVSERMRRLIDREWREQFQILFKKINYKQAHFDFRFALPKQGAWLTPVNNRLVKLHKTLSEQGFEFKFNKRMKHFPLETNNMTLALLTEQYSYPQYQLLNQMLRRRSKWLIPNL